MPVSSRFCRNVAVEEADGGEVLDAGEADPLQLLEEDGHQPERVGAADAREHRRLAHDRQHLAGHVDDDRVRVAVGQQPGERAAARHPVAAGVVDDDQVAAARLGALGGQARARAGADDRLARLDLRAQPGERLVAGHLASRIISSSRSAIAQRERLVVHVQVELVHLDVLARASRGAPRAAPRRPRGRGTAGPPSAIIETPRSGTKSAVGPFAPDSLRPIRRPSSRHSSGVVRISVIVGLWT